MSETNFSFLLILRASSSGFLHRHTDAMKDALTRKKPNDYAVIKKGTNITILEVVEKDGAYWGKNYSGYVCLNDGSTTYCKKV